MKDTNNNEQALKETPQDEIFTQEEIKNFNELYPEGDEGTETHLLHTEPRKAAMLKSLIKYLGIVSYASQEAGISRRTHYNWCENDQEYRAAVEAITDMVIDYAEGKLFKHIQKNDMRAIAFLLRYRGKERGYTLNKDKDAESLRPVINYYLKDKETMEMVQRTKEDI